MMNGGNLGVRHSRGACLAPVISLASSMEKYLDFWNSDAMGNRISDVGKMRSNAGGANRIRIFDGIKTAKLGTEKNPAVVTVQTENRFKEVTSVLEEKGWRYRISLEPDKPEDIADLTRLLNPLKPKIAEKKVGRNEPCPCGSGKKFKNCCAK
jgi:SWIM/SEC-C metal-binding protein